MNRPWLCLLVGRCQSPESVQKHNQQKKKIAGQYAGPEVRNGSEGVVLLRAFTKAIPYRLEDFHTPRPFKDTIKPLPRYTLFTYNRPGQCACDGSGGVRIAAAVQDPI